MATTQTSGHDFGTVAGISAFFDQQRWPLPAERLDDPAYIEGWRKTWRTTLRYGFSHVDPPDTKDLFRLAVDACYGPYAGLRGVRFRVARLMASQDQKDKGSFVKSSTGKPYKNASIEQTFTNVETMARPVEAGLAMSLATGIAPVYQVNPLWLVGEPSAYDATLQTLVTRALAGDDRGDGVQEPTGSSRPWFPAWLVPWMRAVDVAVSTCEVLDDDLLLSDARYAGEMLERFLHHRRSVIEADPRLWSPLVFFPLAHAALVEARDFIMDGIPAWMMPDGDAASLRLSIGQRSRRRALQRELKGSKERNS